LSFREHEYAELRRTIAIRGTVRMALVPITFVWWAALTLAVLHYSTVPVASLYTLAVLAAGFEAVHALHVGVERIGRYLQVCYEEGAGDESVTGSQPGWETTAMAVGPALPGGGVDPLFTVLFCCGAIINLLPALLPGPKPIEVGVVGGLHLAFIVRVVRARSAAARQRAVELGRFRDVFKSKSHIPTPKSEV
jgi:hypothetical protein